MGNVATEKLACAAHANEVRIAQVDNTVIFKLLKTFQFILKIAVEVYIKILFESSQVYIESSQNRVLDKLVSQMIIDVVAV